MELKKLRSPAKKPPPFSSLPPPVANKEELCRGTCLRLFALVAVRYWGTTPKNRRGRRCCAGAVGVIKPATGGTARRTSNHHQNWHGLDDDAVVLPLLVSFFVPAPTVITVRTPLQRLSRSTILLIPPLDTASFVLGQTMIPSNSKKILSSVARSSGGSFFPSGSTGKPGG
jgi:hypothetical protein